MKQRPRKLLSVCSTMLCALAVSSQAHAQTGDETIDLPATFQGADNSDAVDPNPWWESFDDQALTELVSQAIAANHDVAATEARLDAAGERVVQTRAPLLPSLSFDASLTAQPSNSQTFQMGASIPGMESENDVMGSGSALLRLSYQFDLFGRQLEAVRASRDNEAAAEDDLDTMAVTVANQVAEAYFDVLAAREQIEIIERQVASQESMLELTQSRYEQADAAASDVLQQRQQIASVRSNRPVAEATLRMALQRLAVLLGRTSQETTTIQAQIPESARLPDLPPPPATGRPTDLLENRPDLRAAQARLDAAHHQRRSSERAFLPTLGISGTAGGSLYLGDEADTQSTWSAGATLSVPLFQGLSDIAATREARATVRESEHSLSQTLLQATTDVEAALAAEQENSSQLEAHGRMFEAAEQAYTVARRSYAAGVGNYLSVMTALATYQSAELTILQSRRNVLSARTQLYQALGGRWTEGLGSESEGGR